ncbi:hypothetical protein ACHWQZ_G010850 [Mnemiopsis leidyi]
MCSEENVLTTFVIEKPLGKSDQMCIIFKALFSTDYDFITQRKINWSKYSEDSMKLVNNEISWDTMLHDSSSDVRSLWSEILEKLQLFETAAPTYEVKLDNSGKVVEKDPWESMSLVRARAKCNRFWKNFEQNPSKMSHNWAMNAQDEYDQRIRDNRMLYEKKITKSMKENPKRFFSYLNSRRKIKSGVSRLKKPDGTITTSAQETADQLADFFEETYITDNCEDSSNDLPLYATTDHIEDLKFNHDEVKTLLSRLSIAKSIGPDGAHPKLLRFLSHDNGFIRTITHLFQSIYDSGEMPTIWKTANVTALHKKGDKGLASNYRPISLTSVLSKVFEKLLRNHILRHFAPHCYDQQHGFQPKKSCLSNLLDCMDTVYDLLDDEGSADIIYLDFQKAFDTVSHIKLLKKLSWYGITGKTLDIVKNFLSDREFRVKVGGHLSSPRQVSSGVPQGSVLGPLLFLIFINDIPFGIEGYISLFADDVKMVCSTLDKVSVQEDLNKLDDWQKRWLLRFNTKDNKCKILHIGKANPGHCYVLGGAELPKTDAEKDLGVLVNETLDWKSQIVKAVKKAKSVIGWTTRNVISREKDVLLNIYKSLVRPHLEYCTQLWNPVAEHGNWKMIMEIEKVQRDFTRLVKDIGLLTYKERLEQLKLTTLLERRMRGDLIETFKILRGINNYGEDLFKVSRGGTKLLYASSANSEKSGFLSNRVVNYWNKLSPEVRDAQNVLQFKELLEDFKKKNQNSLPGNYWELSEEIFNRISVSNRDDYVSYQVANPDVMKRRKITVTCSQ